MTSNQPVTSDSNHFVFSNDFHRRRFLEMKRRFIGLRARRNSLERQLNAVQICLTSLDKQMKCYSEFEELIEGK